jgi:hypothetical protein
VISGPFFNFLLHNHFINKKKYLSFPGEVKDSVIFLFLFLLHKLHKPILAPCVHFSNHKLIITLYSPLESIKSTQNRYQLLQTHPSTHPPIPPSTHSSAHPTLNPSVCPVTTVERMDV